LHTAVKKPKERCCLYQLDSLILGKTTDLFTNLSSRVIACELH